MDNLKGKKKTGQRFAIVPLRVPENLCHQEDGGRKQQGQGDAAVGMAIGVAMSLLLGRMIGAQFVG